MENRATVLRFGQWVQVYRIRHALKKETRHMPLYVGRGLGENEAEWTRKKKSKADFLEQAKDAKLYSGLLQERLIDLDSQLAGYQVLRPWHPPQVN